jgi:hypothetical protein
MITEKQELRLEISNYKYKLRSVLKEDANSNLKDIFVSRIEYLELKLARLQNIELKLENKALETKDIAPKLSKTYYDTTRRYYQIWLDGSLYLECTSCSADGPGNCSCWLID